MDDLKSFHYKFSKIVLSMIGLWPYDKSWLTKVKRIFVLAIMVAFITFLLMAYFLHQAKCSGILFINTLFYMLLVLIVILKYCVFWYHSNEMKSLVEMLRDSWRSLNNEDERQIILKYAEKGKFQYTIITLFFYIPLCTDICMEITKSQNMDICESSMNLYTTVIYITVDKTYSRILSLQACSALIFGAMTISVTETTVTMIIYYITGLFEVIRYRMRNVFNERIKTRTDETARERLVNVARIHTRTIHWRPIDRDAVVLRTCERMDVTYLLRTDYAFNKKLLELLGLWPTARSKFRLVLFYIYYVCYLLFQISWFFTLECDFMCVLNVLPIFLPTVCILLQYGYRHKYMTTVYSLFTAIDLEQNFFKNDEQSIKILRRYAVVVHVLSILAMFAVCLAIIIVISLLPVVTSAFHIPEENDIRYWQRPIALKSLEKTVSFCNPSFILCYVTHGTTGMIMAANELNGFVFFEHVCALFKIVSCHLKRATIEYVMKLPQCDKTNNIYTKIIVAVQIHTRALNFLQIIWNQYETYYVWMVICITVAISTSTVGVYKSIQIKDDYLGIILTFSVLFAFLIYAVISTFVGQRLIDHSSDIFYETYNSYWYRIPLKAQKMYLMILLRSVKSCSFSRVKFFTMSLEGLCTILNTTFSFITVFLSVQK